MLRYSIPCLLITLFPVAARGEYDPPALFDLLASSDLVALGEIETVGENTYTFRIERILAGKTTTEVVEIERFQDWGCSWRWAHYEKGQKQVVFADQNPVLSRELGRTVYALNSAGCEAEFPVIDEHVYCYLVRSTAKSSFHELGKRHHRPFRCRLSTLIDAFEGFHSLYNFSVGEPVRREIQGISRWIKVASIRKTTVEKETPFRPRRKPQDRYVSFARTSPLHQYLIDSTEAAALALNADP